MSTRETDGGAEVVRGRVEGALADEIVAFWTRMDLVAPASAAERLRQVLCVLRTPGGDLAGVNSAFPAEIPLVGNRRFWVYRSALAPDADESGFFELLESAFAELAHEFETTGEGPVGVCLTVADEGMRRRHPEAIWPDSGFLYAGFAADGGQLRIRYFEDARI